MEEMDVDIPLPDELEWLENQYHDEADSFSYPPDEDEEEEAKQEHLHAPFPAKPPPTVEIQSKGSQKRPISLQEEPSIEKRSRIANNQDDVHDDDEYLRYSPPPQEINVFEQREISEPEEIIVSRFASKIDGEFIPVTAPGSGDRVYSKFCRIEPERETNQLRTSLRSKGLLLEPVHILLQKCEQETFSKCLRTSSEEQSDVKISEAPMPFEKLWVDKYAPNSFTELLSDEQTNREVLVWLKQWDSCVFGSEIRTTGDEVLSALRRHSSVAHNPKRANANFLGRNKGQRWNQDGLSHPTNADLTDNNSKSSQEPWNKNSRVTGPPDQKILLLCGPPGLGKTTLAHVAAKHCGYRVVEINASDDRSSSTIETKILDVVQMNSVMADSKPKCLIIDEIDGALGDGKGAVEVILKMVAAERKSDGGKQDTVSEEQSGKNFKRKRKKASSLSRPVICICNDLYAPALRPLRQIAKVHMFVQPSVSRVVSRLKHICSNEGVKTSSIALTSLAEYTECDIRSCLNTLQFLNKRNQTLNVVDISSQVVGRKDMSRNIFDIWKEIFQKRKSKRERNSLNSCSSQMSSEFDVLHHLISSRGDYDLVMEGIHENILQQQYHDPKMQKTVACLNIIGVSDLVHQYTMRSQKMNLLVYQPPLAIGVHHLVAQVQRPNIEWPKSFQRYRTTLRERLDSIRTWQNRISPHISRHLSAKTFVEDLVSPLLHVLSPPHLRPVAMHLLTEKEKNDLSQLISRMVSYCVSYKSLGPEPQPRSLRVEQLTVDASSLVLDPPIGDYISFKDYVHSHHVLALAVKQMLLHEVEKQKIMQGVERSTHVGESCKKENKDIGGTKSQTQKAGGTYPKDSMEQRQKKGSLVPSNAIASRSVSAVAPTGATTTDLGVKPTKNAKRLSAGFNYFDRFRKTNNGSSQKSSNIEKKAPTSDRDSHPVLFKFNEGFTNAIKRPARIRDFLL